MRGEFGYWVFEGEPTASRSAPRWNYRKEDDGGIIVDMLCHWRYVIENLFGEVKSVSCLGATHVPSAWTNGQAVQVHRGRFGLRHVRTGRTA